jgi:hypothetical protein
MSVRSPSVLPPELHISIGDRTLALRAERTTALLTLANIHAYEDTSRQQLRIGGSSIPLSLIPFCIQTTKPYIVAKLSKQLLTADYDSLEARREGTS